MRKFAIKNEVYQDKTVAWLYYDEEKRNIEFKFQKILDVKKHL